MLEFLKTILIISLLLLTVNGLGKTKNDIGKKIYRFNVRFKVENGANMSTQFTVYNVYKTSNFTKSSIEKQYFKIKKLKTIKAEQVDMDMVLKWTEQPMELIKNHKGLYQLQDDDRRSELSPLDPRIVVKNIIIPMTTKSNIKFERHTKTSWLNCYYNYIRAVQKKSDFEVDSSKNISQKLTLMSNRMPDNPPDDTHCLLDVSYPKDETVDFFIRYNPKMPCKDTIPIAKEFKIKNGFFRMQSTENNKKALILNFRIKKLYSDNDPNNYIKWIISVESLN